MREWFKKYLGWLGFFTWITFTLLFVLDEFMLKKNSLLNKEFLFFGFLIMAGAQTIQDIINEKYLTKYSEKIKDRVIVFIICITMGFSYYLIS